MQTSIITGSWDGYFEYGYEYSFETDYAGQRVQFKMVLKEYALGQFRGNCIEIDGLGRNDEVSLIEGFTEGDYISFVKYYPSGVKDPDGRPAPADQFLSYEGNYDWHTHAYSGRWEIVSQTQHHFNGGPFVFGSGNWTMRQV